MAQADQVPAVQQAPVDTIQENQGAPENLAAQVDLADLRLAVIIQGNPVAQAHPARQEAPVVLEDLEAQVITSL